MESSNEIPVWIKNNAGWWAEGTIDDDSFVQGIQFLIKEGIMSITQVQESEQSVSSVSTSDDSVLASLEAELEKCSEIVKAYKRIDCEKPIKQEILVHSYKTGAELMQVGPVNYWWFGVNSEGNNELINATIDGIEMSVPLDPANRHYAEIMRQVEAGELTIQDADA